MRDAELHEAAGVGEFVVTHRHAEQRVRAAPAARADEDVALAVKPVVYLSHGARDVGEVRLLAVNIRIDEDDVPRAFQSAVGDHAVAAQDGLPRRRVGDLHTPLVVVDGERAQLHERKAVVAYLIGELHVHGELELFFKQRKEFLEPREEFGAAARQLGKGEDRARSVHVAWICVYPVERVVVEPLQVGGSHPVFFQDVLDGDGNVLRGEFAVLYVDIVVVLLRMGHYLMGLRPLGTEVGVCQVKCPGVGPVDGAGAEAEADAHDAVLFPDPRRGPAKDLREGGSRKLGIEHVPVPASLDGLDQDGHALPSPLDAVLAFVFPRGGIVGGGVDDLYRPYEFGAAFFARTGVG
ncbi:hypothetical protein SDC9_102941 [bioreactor metagenome]|uniref:Uncharacterized protein n=1 Tax=bioreactor metagenome TaxID=1076179 RepID=A0A645AV18_9ZZZZ